MQNNTKQIKKLESWEGSKFRLKNLGCPKWTVFVRLKTTSLSGSYPWDKFQERQADVFAAYLLMPRMNNSSVQEIVNRFSVTEKFANFRLKLLEAFKQ
ncbi:MAG: hypothetical protein COW32_03995 [Candidatus Aquicultor secundus]|uniref:Uncharacterized protein n=1 Tax=Candidatus Aquicultor secundus TaxID=1973895 RepID=A0A2M7T7S7_9ACTN|nr:MAG: hypothetical protein AUK32_08195 [Candidatus Aquicultor secundus]PIU26145.1 MAG: hypothetical protein COT10_10210 [Candidatus Aquicultor secundus]PIW22554.1 MAG: hypothetical protein COW32_03995 [Candidatus Aquicultor secundus]PIX52900.1 MAG: hypothetical protein COZ51_01665 [Candidatus Aquicultor secundus]PIY40752.1 MAG: hypothetical protein COZ03_03545 [Candidatus Aquicultor secundus]